jgi:hypothetical protein
VDKKLLQNWIVDLKSFTCLNAENKIVICFEKKGNTLRGKIKDIPLTLLNEWTEDPDVDKRIRKALIEADEVFFNAYFAKEIERKDAELLT